MILGLFVRSSQGVTDALAATISQALPTFDKTIIAELVRLSSERIWGIIGVGFLLVSIVPFSGTIRDTMGRVQKVGTQLPFWKSYLVDGAGAIALLLLVVLLIGSNVVAVLAQSTSLHTPVAAVLRQAGLFLVSVPVLSFFYLMFSYPTLVRPAHLVFGSVVAAVLLALIRPFFGLVLEYNPNYGYMFGSLKTVFLLVVWIYYAFCAILFGAETMANSRRREALLLRRLFLQRGGAQAWIGVLQRFLRIYPRGQTIIEEGEPGQEMFCILDGEVVLRKGGVMLKTMRAGEYFGEMSNAPRCAADGHRRSRSRRRGARGHIEVQLRHDPPREPRHRPGAAPGDGAPANAHEPAALLRTRDGVPTIAPAVDSSCRLQGRIISRSR